MSGFDWGAFGWNLVAGAGAATAVMLVTFLIALRKGVHRIVDVAWGLGFAAVALVSYALPSGDGDGTRRALVTVLTVVWGIRLAVHIGRRGRGHGEDPRYAAMLAKAPGSPSCTPCARSTCCRARWSGWSRCPSRPPTT